MLRSKSVFSGLGLIRTSLVVAALMLAQTAHAGSIFYGDFDDNPPGGVVYLDVTESGSLVPPAHYGAPIASGNSLVFTPASTGNFVAGSNNDDPAAPDLVDVSLSFIVETLPGASLETLEISEGGGYFLGGSPGPGTNVSATVVGTVTILEVNGEALDTAVFSTYTGNTFFETRGPGAPQVGAWNAGALIEFGSLVDLEGGGVTRAIITVDNILSADSALGGVSSIDKKGFVVVPGGDLLPDSSVIPEPASAAILAVACFGFAARRRR